MRLLICTQKVDKHDDVLGFFHEWLKEFSKHYEKITVVALQVGEYDLPSNVSVYSLGKESGRSRLKYVNNFVRYIVQFRKEYDAVFVHMNVEYVVLGGALWKLWRKKVALWYNHKKASARLRIATFFSDHIFYTSTSSASARFKQAQKFPVGIPLGHREVGLPRKPNSILSLGRISPVKKVDIIIEALSELMEQGIDFEASIYGDPTEKDAKYYAQMQEKASLLVENGRLSFHQGIPYTEVPQVYGAHEIFINATPSGSFDKTILEAIQYGAIPVVCNKTVAEAFPEALVFEEGNSHDLAQKLEVLLAKDTADKEKVQRYLEETVLKEHSLQHLGEKLARVFKT